MEITVWKSVSEERSSLDRRRVKEKRREDVGCESLSGAGCACHYGAWNERKRTDVHDDYATTRVEPRGHRKCCLARRERKRKRNRERERETSNCVETRERGKGSQTHREKREERERERERERS